MEVVGDGLALFGGWQFGGLFGLGLLWWFYFATLLESWDELFQLCN